MLPIELNIALKEWAVVQRALLEGHQIMLLRKGGIIEESGDFDLKSRHFLIHPTYAHETERSGDLQPCFSAWLNDEETRKTAPDVIRFGAACEVIDVIRVKHPETLIKLSAQHIWSEQFVRGRFEWEPYKPIFVILVRAYALATPVIVPFLPEYGGCKSWITLREPISTTDAIPALHSDESFERRLELTKKQLGEGVLG